MPVYQQGPALEQVKLDIAAANATLVVKISDLQRVLSHPVQGTYDDYALETARNEYDGALAAQKAVFDRLDSLKLQP